MPLMLRRAASRRPDGRPWRMPHSYLVAIPRQSRKTSHSIARSSSERAIPSVNRPGPIAEISRTMSITLYRMMESKGHLLYPCFVTK